MGFSYHAITLPKPITFFFNILTYAAGFLFLAPLTLLGFRKPPPEEDAVEEDSYYGDFIFVFDGCSPSLVPIPVSIVTAAIKDRVPVLRYGDFLRPRGLESELGACSICLECVELRDEIREPCICGHVFHRACLDGWIDMGRVNCPLCRTMLLPPKTNLMRCMRDYPDRALHLPN